MTTTAAAGVSRGTDGLDGSQASAGASTSRLTRDELIGRVAVLHLWERLTRPDDGLAAGNDPHSGIGPVGTSDGAETTGGTARFIIDCLTGAQTVAIARSVLADPNLSAQFDIKLPVGLVDGFGLPPEVLTTARATYFRNAPCPKPALLLANTGDDEEQSLRELTPMGAPDLRADIDLWVQVAGAGLVITDDERRWWERALRGLEDLHLASLDRFADYVLRTRALIDEEGLTVPDALDRALPALGWPKNAGEFSRIAPRAAARPRSGGPSTPPSTPSVRASWPSRHRPAPS